MVETIARGEAIATVDTFGGLTAAGLADLAGGLAVLSGIEVEALMLASVSAATVAAGLAAGRATTSLLSTWEEQLTMVDNFDRWHGQTTDEDDIVLGRVWLAICKQHPSAVREMQFFGVPFRQGDVEVRWPRLVQTLNMSEECVLDLVETDATPLLLDPDLVERVFNRLAAISSTRKALELVRWNPSLLVGGVPGLKDGLGPETAVLLDVLYSGRLNELLEDSSRDNAAKTNEIETYTYAVSLLKPVVEILQRGGFTGLAARLCRKPIEIAAEAVPDSAMQVFLRRVAVVPDPIRFLVAQAEAGLRMGSALAQRPSLASRFLPYSPSILPHLPAIYTRLSILRPHVPGIVRILDPYFHIVEPHLDRLMDRMDQIEPHLPYILLHLDVLAKHCGLLLDHFDDLIVYASPKEVARQGLQEWAVCYDKTAGLDTDELEACMLDRWNEERWAELDSEIERETAQASYLPYLLPYVDSLVPRLRDLAPHLPLVHPHLPYVLPYMDRLLPYIPRFVAFRSASANADVLIGYLGWTLRVPFLHRVLALPLVPRILASISRVLPRRFIRPVLERNRRRWEEAEALKAAS